MSATMRPGNASDAKLQDLLDADTGLIMHLRLPSMTREPDLRIQYRNGDVSVSGAVPETEFIEQLVAALAMAFAVDEVDNGLRVDPDVVYSDWLEGILRIVFPLAMTHWLEVEISEGKATLRGAVRHEEELEILREQIRDNFDYPIRVVNLIQ
jgi:HSP20 family molecular chaperone IbpA